ncbi:hypothetical protein QNO07_09180 [Streptomyces sp. 549]|uniref:putative phage holin n=1 Tax=Streptomyces sp. 549 TaxID=3049076 RepID=UPI0024C40DAD|nr:hypothetical protein [Streptomyces sp. 549]MDK1473590.1 hypothetical protein [Streptomyces sp. 549]
MDLDWARWMNVSASTALALSALVFVVVYHVLAPWWRSAAGRHLMAVAVTLGLLGAYTVVITAWPECGWLRVARSVVVVVMAGLLVQRTVMVVRAQREP